MLEIATGLYIIIGSTLLGLATVFYSEYSNTTDHDKNLNIMLEK